MASVFLGGQTLPVITFRGDVRGFDDASSTETSGRIYNRSFKTFCILLLKML